MEKEETVAAAGRRAVPGVQGRDAVGGRREELLVFRKALRRRVAPIREEREAQVSFAAGERVDLEGLDLSGDLDLAAEQRRNDDEGSELFRDAAFQLELRQAPGASVTSRLMTAIASSEAGIMASSASSQSQGSRAPRRYAAVIGHARITAVRRRIEPM